MEVCDFQQNDRFINSREVIRLATRVDTLERSESDCIIKNQIFPCRGYMSRTLGLVVMKI